MFDAGSTLERWGSARGMWVNTGDPAIWMIHSHYHRWWDRLARRWRFDTLIKAPPSIVLLYAIALELDEREATVAGEVCRACGDRGEVIVGWYPHGTARAGWLASVFADVLEAVDDWANECTSPLSVGPPPVEGMHATYDAHEDRLILTCPCPCDGPKRPHTVQLHRLVADLAACSRPRFQWPDEWLVRLDMRLDGNIDWIGRWWVAFCEWTVAGKVPDPRELAKDLGGLFRPAFEAHEAVRALL